ncbi:MULTISPECIES: hypothetical protein [Luteibacter]|uniref:Uncharacterized protein n=1 Tax=Luteibacter flocculans TaxID=2780091 RepID=A0ABY4T239_9GAMM|nr:MULTISPECIES: hypothetical protein [Luteibacter]URL58165.1 hypothetical protein IM816_16440 [Luteibacter flocculans]SFW74312.1 hypothetical protein SAMN02800691_3416 [Luteibacter sp. UNCMF366Tsu5.1]
MIVGLLFVNLIACCVMAASAVWLVTDRARGRWPRICLALILCGAMVNVVALWSAFTSFHPSHPVTWPPEAMLNLGSAVLLLRWAVKSFRQRPAAPDPAA